MMRRMGLLLLGLALSACAGAGGGGYWQCREGRWVAQGTPGHPEPLLACGAPRRALDDRDACLRQGGRWGQVGLSPRPMCSLPSPDAGRPCADSGECEGMCEAELTPAEHDAVIRGKRLARLGACTPRIPVLGCRARVERGRVAGILCID
jgi:hypothetical protein